MIRVLHIFHEMANGGIEKFVMDYYRHIDRDKIQFDFLVSNEEEGYYDKEILSLGGKIFHAFPLKKNPMKCFFSIAKIVRANGYEIVHRHTGSAFGYFELRAAKFGGAKHLILHSHNNHAGNMSLHVLSKIFLKTKCKKIACSRDAGEWLFGAKSDFFIINNAIECDRYQYTEEIRNKTRKLLNCDDKLVVGHVGRFERQKNHKRLLEIFKAVIESHPNSMLVCVGIGSLLNECKEYAKTLGIAENVVFLGARSDINELMQAFDVFVLPSLYEGFPFVLVEAQTSGLQCVVSKKVPDESNVAGKIQFVKLENSDIDWANIIVQQGSKNVERERGADIMKERGYDISKNARDLCEFYMAL